MKTIKKYTPHLRQGCNCRTKSNTKKMAKTEVKMTEQQFIVKFKKAGFELYKTRDLKPKLDVFYKVQEIVKKAQEKKA